MSRPTVSKAQTSYPIFAASFANSRPGYLVVGGGGGGGRHGVKNKITLLDFSSRAPTVNPCAEIEASNDDSVTCLANLATKDGLILYAGINSSEDDRVKGNNEHFRSFEVQFPKGKVANNAGEDKTPQGKIAFLSKTTLFATPESTNAKKEGYQRLVRLSPSPRTASSTPNKRIGAIASSLAGDENEIVIFSATSNKPQNPQDVIQRIALNKGQETNDLDILDQSDGQFRVAYVLDHDVYVQDVNYDFGKRRSKDKAERRKLYSVPFPDVFEKKGRPKLRCLRWLSQSHILLLANKSNRTGVELLVLRLYEDGPGSIIIRKTLPKHVKQAVDMDVALLDPDSDGAYQIGVAIGGIDISLTVYTIDYHGHKQNSLSHFHSFNTYQDVHDVQMTKVVFSPFIKPDSSPGKKPGPQYLRLASTSLGNTISVETFELQPISSKPKSRHVLQTARSRTLHRGATYLLIAMIVAAIALMAQTFIDPEGSLTKGIIPQNLQNAASEIKPPGLVAEEKRRAAAEAAGIPVVKTTDRIADLLNKHSPKDTDTDLDSEPKALVIHHDPEGETSLNTEVHHGSEDVVKRHTEAKTWDELTKEERTKWRSKLVDAGMWAVEEGETILKGIFFSEAAGLVGQAVHGVIG